MNISECVSEPNELLLIQSQLGVVGICKKERETNEGQLGVIVHRSMSAHEAGNANVGDVMGAAAAARSGGVGLATMTQDEKRDEPDGVHSLGEALAGMNMSLNGGSASTSNHATTGLGLSAATAFRLAPGSTSNEQDTWGSFADPLNNNGKAMTTTTSMTTTSSTTSTTLEANSHAAAAATQLSSDGLELFLSQSPSRSLGDDVFKLSHPNLPSLVHQDEERSPAPDPSSSNSFLYSASHHSLAPGPGPTYTHTHTHPSSSTPAFRDLRPTPPSDPRRRTDSPSCSVTGTTTSSRSVSPYTQQSNVDGRTIQAFPRYDSHHPQAPTNTTNDLLSARNYHHNNTSSSFAEDERSSPGYHSSLSHGHGSHPSLADTLDSAHRSPYAAKDRTPQGAASFRGGTGSPQDQLLLDRSSYAPPAEFSTPSYLQQQQQQSQSQSQPYQTPSSAPGGSGAPTPANPQVLYMAVPSPDGRGQVLQPVQIVQLPGKPYHFVGSIAGQGDAASQSMMVLPPLPTPPPPSQTSNGMGEYPSPLGAADMRASMDKRSRVANYALDATNRQYSLDTSSPQSSSRDEFSQRSGVSSPFPMDPSIASLYASPQRPPLDVLLGQLRRLSRDQVGCRLVQQALDEEGPMAASLILNEGLPFWGEAMVDPFGNYLFQKILEKVTPEERIMLIKSVSPRLVNASLNLHGTRSVQKVVELCSMDEQSGFPGTGEESAADILTASLSPAAARLCIDSHGNHVIQRILLKLGPKHSKFVFDAVAASVGDVARHRHGCCVIQRCLDSPPTESRAHLVRRIVEKALELMQDAYGNYVVQYVLDVCSDEDVHAVCEAVVGKVNLLAIQKFSSNVMEKCLERCSDRIKEMYLAEMSDPERIRELMMDPFGNYVVQRALSVATHAQAVRLVEAMRPHLLATQTSGPHGQRNGGVRNTAGGRRIIAKISRRFPNFTLNGAGSQDELYSSNKGTHRHHHHPHPQHHHHPPPPHHNAPVMTAYAPVGAPLPSHQHFLGDLRMSPGHLSIQPQQPTSFYSTAAGGSPFYEHQFNGGGRGGFSGM